MKTFKITTLSLILVLFTCATTTAQTNVQERQKHYQLEKGVALQGYDPVSYFNNKKPLEGEKDYAATHKGVTYYFASSKNKELFKSNPDKYEPSYGGWCAYAIADRSFKMEPDPETYKIIDGKLTLFYNSFFNNTLKTWNKDEPKYQKKADVNWDKIVDED
ncbi:YHS domain-containing (seleno)protein [Fulvivirgaceae bacterium BMA10]|uniref:YHS domain-containing (Seleno)protein n=1 Tax=Splendidivirga corallicola TaxID=3051826 RepID=A0ABT8KSA3_9BACT|nr:YHS domain-containing (seleno)protein [Fulvivirgaceae bacterium BMA10]